MADTPATADLRAALVGELADRLADGAVPGAGPGSSVPDPVVNAVRRAIRTLAGRPDLPVLPVVPRALLPSLQPTPDLDRSWLELVSAVRPRLAWLEARQLDPARAPWPAAVAAPQGSTDPWHKSGPVLVAYSAGVAAGAATVAIAVLDAWVDSIPSRRHATTAAFGFNSPKSRAPQAVLLAVPPDPAQRLDNAGLLDVILETRELVQARATRPTDVAGAAVRDALAPRACRRAREHPRGMAGMTSPLYFRLEPGRPDSEEGLRARVADPVWFLARQWQLGELQGEDASSPVVVSVATQHVPITYDPARPDLDPTVIPAEALVEAEPGDWWTVGRRVRLGRAAAALIDADAGAANAFGTLPAPYDLLAGEVDGLAVFQAGLLPGHAIWAEVPVPPARSLVVVRADVRRLVRRRRHAAARSRPSGRRPRLVLGRRGRRWGHGAATGGGPELAGDPRPAGLSGGAEPAVVAAGGSRSRHRRVRAGSVALRHDAPVRRRAGPRRRLVLLSGAAAFRPGRGSLQRRAGHPVGRHGPRQLRRDLGTPATAGVRPRRVVALSHHGTGRVTAPGLARGGRAEDRGRAGRRRDRG